MVIGTSAFSREYVWKISMRKVCAEVTISNGSAKVLYNVYNDPKKFEKQSRLRPLSWMTNFGIPIRI